MRRVLLLAVGAACLAAVLLAMAQEMKFETDRGAAASTQLVRFDARAKDTGASTEPALRLWDKCASHVNHVRVVVGPVADDDAWAVTLTPALGEHTERRLVGCLEDLTVDGVLGRYLGSQSE
ncbi:hypothetical protein ACFYT3_25690 [Nocardia amikacinitolerans]|uniref:hypothetical protein n=1 Tax=Nocardia amikacinitolerans TaxID=756689 RepID=UPI0020A587E4|nr:hypothetical protein [Nocardia amikacinitolerans]MCP2289572.1 hypothetical protein [Nocardia amikacinitolerans]